MSPERHVDDEGAPPQVYRDDELINVDPEDAIVVDPAEASSAEDYAPQEQYHGNKYVPPQLQCAWLSVKTW